MTKVLPRKAAVLIALLASVSGAPAFAADTPARAFTVVEKSAYTRPAPKAPAPAPVRRWDVPADTPLRQVLQTWAVSEGWAVYWPAAADGGEWVTEVSVNFPADDFQQAVTKLIDGLPSSVGLAATFNRSNSPMLLHVSESPNMQEIR